MRSIWKVGPWSSLSNQKIQWQQRAKVPLGLNNCICFLDKPEENHQEFKKLQSIKHRYKIQISQLYLYSVLPEYISRTDTSNLCWQYSLWRIICRLYLLTDSLWRSIWILETLESKVSYEILWFQLIESECKYQTQRVKLMPGTWQGIQRCKTRQEAKT